MGKWDLTAYPPDANTCDLSQGDSFEAGLCVGDGTDGLSPEEGTSTFDPQAEKNILLCADGTCEPAAERLTRGARQFGEYDGPLAANHSLLQEDPDNAKSQLEAARLHREMFEYESAVIHYGRAVALSPELEAEQEGYLHELKGLLAETQHQIELAKTSHETARVVLLLNEELSLQKTLAQKDQLNETLSDLREYSDLLAVENGIAVFKNFVQAAYFTEDSVPEELQKYLTFFLPGVRGEKSTVELSAVFVLSSVSEQQKVLMHLNRIGLLEENKSLLRQSESASDELRALYYQSQVFLMEGDLAAARLSLIYFKEKTTQTEDSELLEMRAETRSQLQSFALEDLDRVSRANAAILEQRFGKITIKSAEKEEARKVAELLDWLRVIIADGKADTLDEAMLFLEAKHQQLQKRFEEDPVVRKGWLIQEPFQRTGKALEYILAGGTVELQSVTERKIIIGSEGGSLVFRSPNSSLGMVYFIPPGQAGRECIQIGKELYFNGLAPGLDYTVTAYGSFDQSLLGTLQSDYRQGHPDSLKEVAETLAYYQDRDYERRHAVGDRDIGILLNQGRSNGLRKMITPEGRKAELLNVAQTLRHRRGSYEVAASALQEIFADSYQLALETISDGERREIAKSVREEKQDDIREEVLDSLEKQKDQNPQAYQKRFGRQGPSEDQIAAIVEVSLIQESNRRIAKRGMEILEAWHNSGRLKAEDPSADQAWAIYEDRKDPFDDPFNISDEGWDRIVDEVVICAVTMPVALGVGTLVRSAISGTSLVLRLAGQSGWRLWAARGLVLSSGSAAEGLLIEAGGSTIMGRDFSLKAAGYAMLMSGAFHTVGHTWRAGVKLYAAQTTVATLFSYAVDSSDQTISERIGANALRMLAFHYGMKVINAGSASVELSGMRGSQTLAQMEQMAWARLSYQAEVAPLARQPSQANVIAQLALQQMSMESPPPVAPIGSRGPAPTMAPMSEGEVSGGYLMGGAGELGLQAMTQGARRVVALPQTATDPFEGTRPFNPRDAAASVVNEGPVKASDATGVPAEAPPPPGPDTNQGSRRIQEPELPGPVFLPTDEEKSKVEEPEPEREIEEEELPEIPAELPGANDSSEPMTLPGADPEVVTEFKMSSSEEEDDDLPAIGKENLEEEDLSCSAEALSPDLQGFYAAMPQEAREVLDRAMGSSLALTHREAFLDGLRAVLSELVDLPVDVLGSTPTPEERAGISQALALFEIIDKAFRDGVFTSEEATTVAWESNPQEGMRWLQLEMAARSLGLIELKAPPRPTEEETRPVVQTTKQAKASVVSHCGGPESKYEVNEDIATLLEVDGTLYAVVIDGGGGSGKGYEASRIANEVITASLQAGKTLEQAILDANARLLQETARLREAGELKTESLFGTVALVSVGADLRVMGNALGDAQVIVIRNGQVLPEGTTVLQNVAAQEVRDGVIEEDGYFTHAEKNSVTHYVGDAREGAAERGLAENRRDFQGQAGDQIVLASDGVLDLVSSDEIKELAKVYRGDDLRRAIFNLAYERNNSFEMGFSIRVSEAETIKMPARFGGKGGDNITVAVVELKAPNENKLSAVFGQELGGDLDRNLAPATATALRAHLDELLAMTRPLELAKILAKEAPGDLEGRVQIALALLESGDLGSFLGPEQAERLIGFALSPTQVRHVNRIHQTGLLALFDRALCVEKVLDNDWTLSLDKFSGADSERLAGLSQTARDDLLRYSLLNTELFEGTARQALYQRWGFDAVVELLILAAKDDLAGVGQWLDEREYGSEPFRGPLAQETGSNRENLLIGILSLPPRMAQAVMTAESEDFDSVELLEAAVEIYGIAKNVGKLPSPEGLVELAKGDAAGRIADVQKFLLGAVTQEMAYAAIVNRPRLLEEGFGIKEDRPGRNGIYRTWPLAGGYELRLRRGAGEAACGLEMTLYRQGEPAQLLGIVGFQMSDSAIEMVRYQGGRLDPAQKDSLRADFAQFSGGLNPLAWLGLMTGQYLLTLTQRLNPKTALHFIRGERVASGYPHHRDQGVGSIEEAEGYDWRPSDPPAWLAAEQDYVEILNEYLQILLDRRAAVPAEDKGALTELDFKIAALRETLHSIQDATELQLAGPVTAARYEAIAQHLGFRQLGKHGVWYGYTKDPAGFGKAVKSRATDSEVLEQSLARARDLVGDELSARSVSPSDTPPSTLKGSPPASGGMAHLARALGTNTTILQGYFDAGGEYWDGQVDPRHLPPARQGDSEEAEYDLGLRLNEPRLLMTLEQTGHPETRRRLALIQEGDQVLVSEHPERLVELGLEPSAFAARGRHRLLPLSLWTQAYVRSLLSRGAIDPAQAFHLEFGDFGKPSLIVDFKGASDLLNRLGPNPQDSVLHLEDLGSASENVAADWAGRDLQPLLFANRTVLEEAFRRWSQDQTGTHADFVACLLDDGILFNDKGRILTSSVRRALENSVAEKSALDELRDGPLDVLGEQDYAAVRLRFDVFNLILKNAALLSRTAPEQATPEPVLSDTRFARTADSPLDPSYLEHARAGESVFGRLLFRPQTSTLDGFTRILREHQSTLEFGPDPTDPRPLQDTEAADRALSSSYASQVSEWMGLTLGPRPLVEPSRDFYAEAHQVLLRIKKLIEDKRAGQTVLRDTVIDLIATYYHTLMVGRPFDNFNHTVFMSEVNVMLAAFGEEPVVQGYLDLLAPYFDVNTFKNIFRAHLEGSLPAPQAIGEVLRNRQTVEPLPPAAPIEEDGTLGPVYKKGMGPEGSALAVHKGDTDPTQLPTPDSAEQGNEGHWDGHYPEGILGAAKNFLRGAWDAVEDLFGSDETPKSLGPVVEAKRPPLTGVAKTVATQEIYYRLLSMLSREPGDAESDTLFQRIGEELDTRASDDVIVARLIGPLREGRFSVPDPDAVKSVTAPDNDEQVGTGSEETGHHTSFVGADVVFLRSSRSAADPTYVANARAAMGYFEDWLLMQSLPITDSSFATMLSQQHRIAALGNDPTHPSPYQVGRSEDGFGYRTDQIHAGVLRSRIDGGNEVDLGIGSQAPFAYAQRIAALLQIEGVEQSQYHEIPGVQGRIWPYNSGASHRFPKSEDVEDYVRAGAKKLEEIRLVLRSGDQQVVQSDSFVDLLAEYYFIMINALPFEQINHSLFMTQVNYLLVASGRRAVNQGYLDHLAFRFRLDDFRRAFRLHLQGELPLPQALQETGI